MFEKAWLSTVSFDCLIDANIDPEVTKQLKYSGLTWGKRKRYDEYNNKQFWVCHFNHQNYVISKKNYKT
jgi:hypothetical protein